MGNLPQWVTAAATVGIFAIVAKAAVTLQDAVDKVVTHLTGVREAVKPSSIFKSVKGFFKKGK